MKREDILRMLCEASDPASDCLYDELITINFGELERFTLLVAARVLASTYPEMFDIVSEAAKAAEREQCAILLETYGLDLCPGDKDVQRYFERTKPVRESYAAVIRARN